MSVVIIGGGGAVRNALTSMENSSITWTAAQRAQAEKLLDDTAKKINDFTAHPQPAA